MPSELLGLDETAPVVTLTSPAAGTHAHGTIVLTVNATDNVGVAGVRYRMNGTALGAEVTTPPFSLAWDTTAVADGTYTLKAVARDAAGNTKGSPGVTVTVSNGRVRVLWSQLVNATAIGKTLSKTGGCDGCADARALSTQTIVADGYLEFRASETSSLRLVGLGKMAIGTPTTPVKYAFLLKPGGVAEVQELGAYRAATTFASGDLFRITIAGPAVLYTKNGVLIHESALAAPSPLRVRASLYSKPSTITAPGSPFRGDRPRRAHVARGRPSGSGRNSRRSPSSKRPTTQDTDRSPLRREMRAQDTPASAPGGRGTPPGPSRRGLERARRLANQASIRPSRMA